jgi:hypothetical protein
VQASSPTADTDRLNGWKEIASYLGKGVRTAQRWERDFGLPVRRLGADGGEIVFASRAEISRWLETAAHSRAAGGSLPDDVADSTEESPPVEPVAAANVRRDQARAGNASGTWRWLLAAAAVILAVAGGFWFNGRPHEGTRLGQQPVSWRVEDDQLTVLGKEDQLLWSFRPGTDLAEDAYRRDHDARDALRPTPVLIEDLEGDGSREVVFPAVNSDGSRSVVYMFNADGTVRFAHQAPTGSFRFGDTAYQADWTLEGTWTTVDGNGQRSLWLPYRHKPYFPSLLVQLDPYGRVLSQYMSNGYVVHVTASTWKGADVVLVGAANNESRGGSLAIFEGRTVRGSAPAQDPKYRCTTCPPGGPDTFLTFPRTCLSLGPGETSRVGSAWIGKDDTVWAEAHHGWFFQRPDATAAGSVIYTLDRNLIPLRVEISGTYALLHKQQLEAGGLTDHVLGPVDQAMVLPVRIWKNGRFEDLPRVAVEIDR